MIYKHTMKEKTINYRVRYTLPDFVAIVCASFQEVVDGASCFQGFVLWFTAHTKDGHVFHGLGQLDHCLTLKQNSLNEY